MDAFDYRKEIEQLKRSIDRLLPAVPEVLIVDDNTEDMCLMCRSLDKFYCNVKVCHDADQASIVMKEQHFDIVFLDLVMPKVSGLELMQRSVGLTPGTHFVLVTGYPSSPFIDETIRLGAVLAAKPITEKTLNLFLRPKI